MWRPPNSESDDHAGEGEGVCGARLLRWGEVHVLHARAQRQGRRVRVDGQPRDELTVVRPAVLTPLQVHAIRHPDEGGDVVGGRRLEDHLRGRELFERPCTHDRQPVAEGQRLGLVVGDVDGREPEPPVQLVDLAAHEVAQPRVEVAQRLVEENQLGAGD